MTNWMKQQWVGSPSNVEKFYTEAKAQHMNDILERLLSRENLGDPLCEEAAAEIRKLRARCKTLENTARINLAAYTIAKNATENDIAALCGGTKAIRRARKSK